MAAAFQILSIASLDEAARILGGDTPGLLALRENKEHMETVAKHGIGLIDMVVVNLYLTSLTLSSRALIATITVLSDMSTAPAAGLNNMPRL